METGLRVPLYDGKPPSFPMHLAILGATGRTGRPLIQQALDAGHTVHALARSPETLTAPASGADRLTVSKGDATDAADVAKIVEGADAVLLALGHTKTSTDDIMVRAAENTIAAMKRHDVTRVITLTGAGVPDPADPPGLAPKILRGIMKLVVGTMLRDSERHVDLFRVSGLDWTAVRAPRLTDGPKTGRYDTGLFAMGPGESVSRADVADYMLRCATSAEASGEAPMIKATS